MAVSVAAEESNNQKKSYSVDAVYNNNSVLFSRLDVVEGDQGLLLKGKIRRRSANTSVPSGHVDILVSNTNGDVLLDTAAHYTPAILIRYTNNISQRGSRFTVNLPNELPEDAVIRVTYHKNSFQENATSTPAQHTKNSLI
jgi:hypothetical protein